jgi:hypothetical protein
MEDVSGAERSAATMLPNMLKVIGKVRIIPK